MELQERQGVGGSSWVRRIVVAVDGSEASMVGLEQVADIASNTGARVTAAFIRHVPTAALMGPPVAGEAAIESLDDQEAEVRAQVTRILGRDGVDWEFVVRVGSPGEQLVGLVEEMDANLVVVGSNRHSSLHNMVVGSTAAYLTAHSPVPVLVMRVRVPDAATTSAR